MTTLSIVNDLLILVGTFFFGIAAGVFMTGRKVKAAVKREAQKAGLFGDNRAQLPVTRALRDPNPYATSNVAEENDAPVSNFHLEFEWRRDGRYLLLRCRQHRDIVFMLDRIEADNVSACVGVAASATHWARLPHAQPRVDRQGRWGWDA